ncbi:MBL fold metallo-hydrolase [Larsenimonas rhizosphaerae]|uniref:MBL fold metallo-hydrolase n=1 Tax=Larsenimonas rhizosphaerae TaxID=2944682 RepID=A0AA41ZQC4_9GAMM|nr:MBL fold metallo-hydrolase [Larsenimonas rhizosphaerae]MCX2525390.1 MBL fold metallo-hydrolase [Larsenimonas rhizosphaerae]
MTTFAHSPGQPDVAGFFDPDTFSVQYVVSDPATSACAIIDPVLDYDEKAGATSTHHADALLDHIAREGLTLAWILDTHPHADHLSAAHYLHERTGAPVGIGRAVTEVQALWKDIYNLPALDTDGRQWDHLFDDGETFALGELSVRVMHSPGHTLASVTYVIGDAAFVHDTLFQPDFGTARADFPGGSASALWDSIQAILALPEQTRLFTGHDYMPDGRAPRWESTVQEQRNTNVHPLGEQQRDEYIAMRNHRDSDLPMPRLLLHALQVNVRGGRLPAPEDNGRRYLKIPLDAPGISR